MQADVRQIIAQYPNRARERFIAIRDKIFAVAQEHQLGHIEETLKWGQPAYLSRHGSTIRLDWQADRPDSLQLCFHCQTSLVETFREIFPECFSYHGNRTLELPLNQTAPPELLSCLYMALNYHRLKKLPLLGAGELL